MVTVNWWRLSWLILILGFLWTYREIPDKKLRIYFCDVGQGDAAVVSYGHFQALIDTGAYESKVLACLEKASPFWDKEIELVFLSHSDKDHVGALPGVKRFYKVKKIIDKASVGDRFSYNSLFFDVVKGSENNVLTPMRGSSESNESSIVLEIRFGEFSSLFTGDIDEANEFALVRSGLLRKIDVLKVAHHGSKYSSSFDFLEAVEPEYAVISVGAKNSYGHPNGDVLTRLDAVGSKTLRTDKLGTVAVVTDGTSLSWELAR